MGQRLDPVRLTVDAVLPVGEQHRRVAVAALVDDSLLKVIRVAGAAVTEGLLGRRIKLGT